MKRGVVTTPTADLDSALAFVIERISRQAEFEAKPLDEDERYLLTHLPTNPTNPTIPGGVADEYGPPMPMLRDFLLRNSATWLRMRTAMTFRIGPMQP